MEISTIVGLSVGTILVLLSIIGDIGAFIDIPSVLIVGGGTVGAVITRYSFSVLLNFPNIVLKTIFTKLENPQEMIKKIISLSIEAKKNGILGLEKVQIDNIFLKKGVQLAIDGVEPELIEAVLNIDLDATENRHGENSNIFTHAGDSAPAFGMIGTLIGLVLMLGNMDDPKSIGPSMAVALLTTLYGSFLANVIFLPLADKLNFFHKREMALKQLIIGGILSIANGDHPAVVQEKLSSFLRPAERKNLDASGKK